MLPRIGTLPAIQGEPMSDAPNSIRSTETASGAPYAHLYAQNHWHDEAYIVGNRKALTGLRDALNAALAGEIGVAEAFAADGEGYFTVCLLRDSVDGMALPYTDEVAAESAGEGRKWPDEIEPERQVAAINALAAANKAAYLRREAARDGEARAGKAR